MFVRRRPRGAAAAVASALAIVAGFALAIGSGTVAVAAPATDYPSWGDVQKAKANQAAKQAKKAVKALPPRRLQKEELSVRAAPIAWPSWTATAIRSGKSTTCYFRWMPRCYLEIGC